MNSRRLYRCRHDRMLAGVAGGMAEYFDVDPTVVRVLWILSVLFGGFSILLYIILAFVMPLEPAGQPLAGTGQPVAGDGQPVAGDGDPAAATSAWAVPAVDGPAHEHRSRGDGRFGLGLGIVLVVFGGLALIGPVFPGWVTSVALGPAFAIALGIALVVLAVRRPAAQS